MTARSSRRERTRHEPGTRRALLAATGGMVLVEYTVVLACMALISAGIVLGLQHLQIPAYSAQSAALYRPYP